MQFSNIFVFIFGPQKNIRHTLRSREGCQISASRHVSMVEESRGSTHFLSSGVTVVGVATPQALSQPEFCNRCPNNYAVKIHLMANHQWSRFHFLPQCYFLLLGNSVYVLTPVIPSHLWLFTKRPLSTAQISGHSADPHPRCPVKTICSHTASQPPLWITKQSGGL